MKVKALLAGLLLAAAGTSHAALIADGVATVSGGAPAGTGATANVTGGGDLFLIVHDDVLDTTYVQNLETDFVAFKNTLSSSDRTFALDALGQSFLSSAGSTFQWAVFAGNNVRGFVGSSRIGFTSYGNVADWGLLTTGGVAGTETGFNPGSNETSTVVTGNLAQNVIGAVNTGLSATVNSAVFAAADPANFRTKGTTLGAAGIYNGNGTNAFLGETSTFWFVSNDYLHTAAQGGGPVVSLLGNFTLTGANLNFVSANPTTVPVPAAVWLLGSALAGFATVARREKKA